MLSLMYSYYSIVELLKEFYITKNKFKKNSESIK